MIPLQLTWIEAYIYWLNCSISLGTFAGPPTIKNGTGDRCPGEIVSIIEIKLAKLSSVSVGTLRAPFSFAIFTLDDRSMWISSALKFASRVNWFTNSTVNGSENQYVMLETVAASFLAGVKICVVERTILCLWRNCDTVD